VTDRSPPLPGAPFLSRAADGRLQLDGLALTDLAAEHGTPLFVYSQAAMLDAYRQYADALAGRPSLVCYAVKANSNLAVLQTFARAGSGFDIVSAGELQRVLAAGGRPNRTVFSGVGKTRQEMKLALDIGVRCFNVESESELALLSQVAHAIGRTARISLRVNPDVDAGTHPYISTGLKGNKFGVAHQEALRLYRQAASLPGIAVTGIDCHIGSQITQSLPYLDALDRILDLVEQLSGEGIDLAHIDVGGGLGISYQGETPPDIGTLVRSMLQRIDARGHGHREVLIEPGRSLVGNAGVMLTEVVHLKPGATKNFCIVDAAMNDLIRPTLYQAWMGVENTAAASKSNGPCDTWDIVGPVCESGDWLAKERELAVAPGDVLAVLSAGAYAMSMASNYNSRGRAAELMIVEGQAHLVRLREDPRQLYAGEHLLP